MILPALPAPKPGDRVTFMGNTGEGKTVLAGALLLSQPDVVIVNTKHDPFFSRIGTPIDDREIYSIETGRFDFRPSDDWLRNPSKIEQFFHWAIDAGNRVIYVDEFNDICPSAQNYPFYLQKCVKQGRWRRLGIWGSSQEPVRVPSFCFGQSQHKYLFYLGWDPHRKSAEAWFQRPIDWSMIPERSHRFFYQNPVGTFGPQPKLDTTVFKKEAS